MCANDYIAQVKFFKLLLLNWGHRSAFLDISDTISAE
jgi:hypothetical protein